VSEWEVMLAFSLITYNSATSIPAVVLYRVVITMGVIHKLHPTTATETTYFRSHSIEALSALHYVITENVPNGTVVADVTKDAGFDRKYSLEVLEQLEFRFVTAPPAGAPLVIDRKSGNVRTDGIVDREMISSCRDRDVCLLALDVAVSPGIFFTIVKLSVEISDVNDNAPRFRQSSYTIEVRESTSGGSSFPLPTAVDLDSRLYGIRRYQLDPETDIPELALSVTSRADGSLEPRLVVRHPLDRETEPLYRLKLWAIDGGVPSLVASADIVVYVVDSNDHSPVFERTVYTVNISEDIPVGSLVVSTLVRPQWN
jgi:Cadherin-like